MAELRKPRVYHCLRCDTDFVKREWQNPEPPLHCANRKCRSPHWDKPRKEKPASEAGSK